MTESKKHNVSFQLDDPTYRRLKEVSRVQERPMSWILRRIVRYALDTAKGTAKGTGTKG